MSLINDALKRAKAAQNQATLAQTEGPLLRPAERVPSQRSWLSLLVPLVATVAALIGLACLWVVRANTTTNQAATAAAHTTSAQANPTGLTSPTDQPGAALPATAPPTNTPALSTAEPAPAVSADPATNTTVAAEPEPPKPAPLRLQAIFYEPRRPAAMIAGKMLGVGDSLGEFRVVAIGRTSATLASVGQTNVLTLAE